MTVRQIEDPATNAGRMVEELQGHFGRSVRRAHDRGERRVGELTRLMCIHLLRPSDARSKAQRRANIAEELYPHLAIGTVSDESYGAAASASGWEPEWTEGLPESSWTSERNLRLLRPDFERKIVLVLRDLEELGWQPIVISGYRSPLSQQKLFIDGKSARRFSFHNTRDDQGNPSALAVDIVDARYRYGQLKDQRSGTMVPHLAWHHKAVDFFEQLVKAAKKHGLITGASEAQQRLKLDVAWQRHDLPQDPSHVQLLPYGDLGEYRRRAKEAYRFQDMENEAEAKLHGAPYIPTVPPWEMPLDELKDMLFGEEERARLGIPPEPTGRATPGGRQLVLDIDGMHRIVPEDEPEPPASVPALRPPRRSSWKEDAVRRSSSSSDGSGGAVAMGLLGLGTALVLLSSR
jgi:hypothetical protein